LFEECYVLAENQEFVDKIKSTNAHLIEESKVED